MLLWNSCIQVCSLVVLIDFFFLSPRIIKRLLLVVYIAGVDDTAI